MLHPQATAKEGFSLCVDTHPPTLLPFLPDPSKMSDIADTRHVKHLVESEKTGGGIPQEKSFISGGLWARRLVVEVLH